MSNKITMKPQRNTNGAQQRKLGLMLKKLALDVTSADKKAAEKKWSKNSIYTYLSGDVKNNDTAVDMIKFFKQRIADRELQLA